MVHDQVEWSAAVRRHEGLRQRRTVVHRVAVAARGPDRRDAHGLVDQRDPDGIDTADARCFVDEHPGRAADARVQRIDQRLQRRRAVVLDLHQRDHVGIDGRQHLDDLGALALELRHAARAAAIGRELARRAGVLSVVDRAEEVVEVGRGDPQVAADTGRRGGARIGARERRRSHWMDLPRAVPRGTGRSQPVVDHTGDRGCRVACPHGAVVAQVGHGRRELQRRAVVQHDGSPGVRPRQRTRGRARTRDVGRHLDAPARGQRQLPETAEEEVLLHRQRPVQRDEHAFETLQAVADGQGQRQYHRRHAAIVAQHPQVGHVVQFGDRVRQRLAVAGRAGIELDDAAGEAHA